MYKLIILFTLLLPQLKVEINLEDDVWEKTEDNTYVKSTKSLLIQYATYEKEIISIKCLAFRENERNTLLGSHIIGTENFKENNLFKYKFVINKKEYFLWRKES